jgi:3',5'-cyclic AMP phosphodiesterase CpdA
MFVLAHLSDPHLGPLPNPRVVELIGKRVPGYVNWQRRRERMHRPEVLAKVVADIKRQGADHIAVTGDLVNLALPDEYAPARAWLDALGGPAAVTLVPGNHDAYVRRGIAHARTHWGDFMCGDAAAAECDFPFVRRRGPVALIGVSTSVPSLPLMATGRVGQEQLQRLPALLDRARSDGLFRVVLIHHPPVSKRSHYLKRLVDAPKFREVIARHGAELVIHGHNHRRQTVFIEGPQAPVPAVGVPSASEVPPGEHDPAGYNLYRIEGTPQAWRCELVARGFSGDEVTEIDRKILIGA